MKWFGCCFKPESDQNDSPDDIDKKISKKKSKRSSIFLESNTVSLLVKEGDVDNITPYTIKYSVSG